MDKTALISLAKGIAKNHGLDPVLVCAVVEQESIWETWATRHEPDFQAHYITALHLADTETVTRSISWGLMQLMGEDARELGFTGQIASLCDPAIGLDYGCRELQKKLAKAGGDVKKGLEFWNGGANPNYAAEVLARTAKYV